MKREHLLILVIGSRGLAAGRKLSQTITFSNLSLSKTNKLLGKAIDLDLDGAEAFSDVE